MIRTSILGDDVDDTDDKKKYDREKDAHDRHAYDALEHYETVALAFEHVFSTRLSRVFEIHHGGNL